MNRKINVLIVHADPAEREHYRRWLLECTDTEYVLIEAGSAAEAMSLARARTPNCILLDCGLPEIDRTSFLRELQWDMERPSVAVVLLAAEHAFAASQSGGEGPRDYLLKGGVPGNLLDGMIRAAMARQAAEQELCFKDEQIARLSQQLAEANSQLALVSRSDSLTRLLNRKAFEESLQLEHARSVRYQHRFGLILVDVDHFKAYNDARGYQAGDECLRRVARAIRDYTRGTDFLGRHGGDEFAILAPETPPEGLHTLAERVRLAVLEMRLPRPVASTGETISVSMGLSEGPAENWEQITLWAYGALQQAKELGGNRLYAHDSAAVETLV